MSTPDANLSSAAAPAQVAPPASGVAQLSLLQTMTVLVQRELWEHRALWMAPLTVAVILVACSFPVHIGPLHFGNEEGFWTQDGNRLAVFGWLQWGLAVPQLIVMGILLNFYLLDCLYAERKDRSILFWKSLPVSDAATVASKLLTGLVIVPLGVFALTAVTNLLVSAIFVARASFGTTPIPAAVWSTVVWLKVEALFLYGLIVTIFWYAPLAAYLVLVSSWARRNVFLWAALPPVIAMLVERWSTGTHYVLSLIEYRTWGMWQTSNMEPSVNRAMTGDSHNQIVSLSSVFDNLHVAGPFLNIDLWIGLAVAAAFAFAAARIRRYRDDT
jgi:ABC-2 type transport system permease protein